MPKPRRIARSPWTPIVFIVPLVLVLVTMTTAWARERSVFDHLALLADVRHQIVTYYVEEPDEEALIEAAVRAMVDELGDPHTNFLTREELKPLQRTVSGQFTGIGAEVDISEADDRLRIITPLEDSPAWKSGVMAGDIVLTIDGVDTEGMGVYECVDRLTGPAGTQVTILVRHQSGEEQEITITRDVINIQTVRGFTRQQDSHYDYWLDKDRGIGYARVTQFQKLTAGDLRAVLEDLKQQGLKALVLDLRFNGGGLLSSAVDMASIFLPEGSPVVSTRGRAVEDRRFDAVGPTPLPDIPLVVLANDSSASASEIVTGALKDNDRALIVGTRTFGKGSVQEIKMLDEGAAAIKITQAHY